MNFQAAAGAQGRAFEDQVVAQLVMVGWRIIDRRWREPFTLVEVDIVAADPTGEPWWIECKGSWQSASDRNGCVRTDTTKKLVANVALLSVAPNRRSLILATSHLPDAGTPARRWLDIAIEQRWLARIEILSTFAPGPSSLPSPHTGSGGV